MVLQKIEYPDNERRKNDQSGNCTDAADSKFLNTVRRSKDRVTVGDDLSKAACNDLHGKCHDERSHFDARYHDAGAEAS